MQCIKIQTDWYAVYLKSDKLVVISRHIKGHPGMTGFFAREVVNIDPVHLVGSYQSATTDLQEIEQITDHTTTVSRN